MSNYNSVLLVDDDPTQIAILKAYFTALKVGDVFDANNPVDALKIIDRLNGDIDLLVNRRVQVGCFPWRFVDGEASIARIVAMVDDDEYEELMAKKATMPKTKFGDCYDQAHVDRLGGRGRVY